MDDLDKQLQQLQLLNKRDLSPKPMQGLTLKKVAPEIPPKPKKNQKNSPQVFIFFLFSFYFNLKFFIKIEILFTYFQVCYIFCS